MIRRGMRAVVRWCDRHWVEVFALLAILLLLLIVFWKLVVYNVPAGHVGVLWYRFFGGTQTAPEEVLGEGFHVVWPWNKIYIYNTRLQHIHEKVTGLSIDGLEVSVELSSRFVIQGPYAGYLHKAIGPDYADTLMRPQLRTLALIYLSAQEASDLFSTNREVIQRAIEARFQPALAEISTNVPFDLAYIKLEDVLIQEITLPPVVRRAIEEKERLRHISESYVFRLELEEQERRRKHIEAEGIRAFQEVVAPGITESYLRWRGIEATLKLSESANSKVVIIGGSDGLPLILNADGGGQGLPAGAMTVPGNATGTEDQSNRVEAGPPLQQFRPPPLEPSLGQPPPTGRPMPDDPTRQQGVPHQQQTPQPATAPTPPASDAPSDQGNAATLRDWFGGLIQ